MIRYILFLLIMWRAIFYINVVIKKYLTTFFNLFYADPL